MDDLLKKYNQIINSVDENLWNDYSNILEKCVIYLKSNNELTPLKKVAATYVVREIFLNDVNFKINNIESIIDDFLLYYHENYESYINQLGVISDQFYTDLYFYKKYIKTRLPQ